MVSLCGYARSDGAKRRLLRVSLHVLLSGMYYVYVLLCGDGLHYTGYTEDVFARLQRHQNREVFSTKGRQPVELIFYEAFMHMQDAKRR